MSDSNTVKVATPGLGVLVFLVFLTLKLAEVGAVASWSWVWVCSPLWIPLVILAAIVLVVLGVALVAHVIDAARR